VQPIDEWIERHKKEPDAVAREKLERFEKAVELKEPDRVPLMFFTCGYVFAKWFKLSEVYFNYERMREAITRFVTSFPSDIFIAAPAAEGFIMAVAFADVPQIALIVRFITGPMHDILRDKWTRWPGKELPPNAPAQFVGGKFMDVEEYDELAKNPINFISKKIIPRIYEALKDPSSPEAYGALIKFGIEMAKFSSVFMDLMNRLRDLGYPTYPSGFGYAPLDFIADHFRHINYTLIDLYRYFDKVRKALDALPPLIMKWSRMTISIPPNALELFDIKIPLAFIPLHLNEMLPPKFFREFYWEPLKKVIIEFVNGGAIPWIFYEGDFTPFLEYILELPKGKTIAYFERTDLRKARKILGDHVIIMGGISPAHYIHGIPEKVFNEVCKLLNDVKEPGGFIFAGSGVAGIPDETKPENLKVAIEAVRKCSVY